MPQHEGECSAGSESDETDRETPVEQTGSGGIPADGEIEREAEDMMTWVIEATALMRPPRAETQAALEEELELRPASDLSAREHMLDLIKLVREGLLPPLDSDTCRVVSLMLAEISAWVVEYDPERERE